MFTRRTTIGLTVLIAALAASARAQTVVYVDQNANQEPHDGSDWCHAYLEVHEALPADGPNMVIRVADGTYLPDTTGLTDPREATFQLADGVALEGGYAGCGAVDPDERDIEVYETILSGDIGTPGDNSDDCYHVVTGSATDETAVLDGFTITGGNASGSWPRDTGGGMYNDGGSPTLTNCTVTGNLATNNGAGMRNSNNSNPMLTGCTFSGNSAVAGGGMYNNYSSPTLDECTFSGNSGDVGGGMVNDHYSSPTLTNCTFSANSAQEAAGGMFNTDNSSPTLANCTFSANTANLGGGMYSQNSSSPTLTNCTFSGNSASDHGGGVCNSGGSPTLANCTFSANTANSGGGMYSGYLSSPTLNNCTFSANTANYGGGMRNQGGILTLTNCTFSGNAGNLYGGGMYNYDSSPTLTNCTFSANSADDGGGMSNRNQASPTLTNCTFSGNSATSGGGMHNYYACIPTLTNCTFNANSADEFGGGMCSEYSFPTLTNCILWGNAAPDGPQVYGPATVTYSCVEGGYDGVGNISVAPQFAGDFRPAPGSPCIDAGDNTAVPPDTQDLDNDGDTTEPCPLDLHGLPRFVDDPATDDTGLGDPPIVDMGAYEYLPPASPLPGDLDNDCDVDLSDLAELLAHYGETCE